MFRRSLTTVAALTAGILIGALATAEPVRADTATDLQAVERALEEQNRTRQALEGERKSLAEELNKLKRDLVTLAGRIQDREAALSGEEDRIDALFAREAALRSRLEERQQDRARVLAALQRAARQPAAVTVSHPGNATERVRMAALLRHVVPKLQQEATEIASDVARLQDLRQRIDTGRDDLVRETAVLETERTRIAALVDRKSEIGAELQKKLVSADEKSAALTERAESLRTLLDRLARDKQAEKTGSPAKPEDAKPARVARRAPQSLLKERAAALRESAGLPARGRVATRFGAASPGGTQTKGVSIRTRAGAQVVAPRNGKIVFSGAFRGYGQLLIIDHGDEYHFVLSGMQRIDAAVGDDVQAGEPVGRMGGASGTEPTLYMELRRNGRSINPLPWLAAGKRKVSG